MVFRTKEANFKRILEESEAPKEFERIEEIDKGLKKAKKVRLSIDYMFKILDILKEIEGKNASFSIEVENDYPVRIKSENMEFILAPRIEE